MKLKQFHIALLYTMHTIKNNYIVYLTFNTLQVVSGRCMLVAEGMITTVSLKYHTAGTVVRYPAQSIILATGQPVFFVELPYIHVCRAFDKGASILHTQTNPDIPDTERMLSPLRLPRWFVKSKQVTVTYTHTHTFMLIHMG